MLLRNDNMDSETCIGGMISPYTFWVALLKTIDWQRINMDIRQAQKQYRHMMDLLRTFTFPFQFQMQILKVAYVTNTK